MRSLITWSLAVTLALGASLSSVAGGPRYDSVAVNALIDSDPAAAVAILKRHAERSRLAAVDHYRLARAYFATGDIDAASLAWQAAKQLQPDGRFLSVPSKLDALGDQIRAATKGRPPAQADGEAPEVVGPATEAQRLQLADRLVAASLAIAAASISLCLFGLMRLRRARAMLERRRQVMPSPLPNANLLIANCLDGARTRAVSGAGP